MITPDFRVDNIASLWDFRVFNGDCSTYILSPGGQRSQENHNRDSQKLKIQASIHYQKYLFHNTSLTSKAMPKVANPFLLFFSNQTWLKIQKPKAGTPKIKKSKSH